MAKLNLGAVTAYADAKAAGFAGTREEFAEWLANAAKNAQAVAGNLEESKKVLADVNTAGETQVGAVQDEGTAQIGNVGAAGSAAVEDVYAAAELKKTEISDIGTVLVGEQNLTAAQQARVKSNLDAADGIIETAAGEVIVLDDASEQHFRGMKIFGKSTQDGTPTPDAPVPIVSAGDDGETRVGVYGKNLCGGNTREFDGYTNITLPVPLPPDTYYVSAAVTSNDTNATVSRLGFINSAGNNTYRNFLRTGNIEQYTVTTKDVTNAIRLLAGSRVDDSAGDTADWTNVQIEKGGFTDYEPYEPIQTLPIATPDGLCGIPVTSGGNYTDEKGQEWVCDEVDFARGVLVQRIGTAVLTGEETWTERTNSMGKVRFLVRINQMAGVDNVAICTHGANLKTNSMESGNAVTIVGSEIYVFWENYQEIDGFVEKLKSDYAAGTPVTVKYVLPTPIETALSETELAAYRALHTNRPNTTIYADDNAGLAVDYAADTKRYIDKKFDALAAAIINNN